MAKHTPGPLIVHAQGDADDYCLLTTDRRWVMAFRQNGELLNDEQKANIDLIAEAFSVATETGMAPRQMHATAAALIRTLEAEREKVRQLETQHAKTVHALEQADQHIGWCWDTIESNTNLRREGSAAVLEQIKVAIPT